MDFMGIGTWELMMIGLIALIVLGPKQMIIMARKAGELLRQVQEIWGEASKTIDKEIKAIEEEAGDLTALPKEITALTNDMRNALRIDNLIPSSRSESTAASQPTIRPPTAPAWTATPPPADPTLATPADASTAPSQPAAPAPVSDQTTQPDQPPAPTTSATTGPATSTPAENQPSQPAGTPVKYSAWTSKKN
jgi:sec-independent protein translocase protein TatB